jgi:hypothetical protein
MGHPGRTIPVPSWKDNTVRCTGDYTGRVVRRFFFLLPALPVGTEAARSRPSNELSRARGENGGVSSGFSGSPPGRVGVQFPGPSSSPMCGERRRRRRKLHHSPDEVFESRLEDGVDAGVLHGPGQRRRRNGRLHVQLFFSFNHSLGGEDAHGAAAGR